MNETNSECEKAFKEWERFLDPPFGEKPVKWWLRLGFDYAWNHQQSKIASLQSDNQKLREALKNIMDLSQLTNVPFEGLHFKTMDIAKAALAETKQEEK